MKNQPTPSSGHVLLIVENTEDVTKITAGLIEAHYKVSVAPTARQAFVLIFKTPPDIIILDINLPDLDGFHVARELRRNMMLRHIPVILLSNRVDFLEKMKSFDVIVDEYIVRPYDLADVVLRTDLVLKRGQSNLNANPLTRLPGNQDIVKAIKERIGVGKPYAVGYADLNNFKAYNDKYGFNRGDDVIKFAAKVILSAVQKFSPADNFVGHIGGDDFIFVCGYDQANELCQYINETFDKGVPSFYSEEDLKKGFIVVEDRRGVVSQFPLVSIAIGMVSDEGKKFSNLGQINHSLTQLKKYAKSFQGSAYVRDRRSLSTQLAEFTWGDGSSAASSKVLESITNALGAYLPGQLADVIKTKAITVLFQPIIEMKGDEIIGHESLVRGPTGTALEFPDAMFQTARIANCVVELDILCMKKMLASAQDFRKGIQLFVNIFPETLIEETRLMDEILPHPKAGWLDLVFELSGSSRASDPTDLFSSLRKLRQNGQKICIDAAVALSPQGLEQLPELRPDYIKLNMMMYKDMAKDVKKHQEFLQAVGFLRQVGSKIICTKIESRADSMLVLKAGITLGQGFLFARPAQPILPSSVE